MFNNYDESDPIFTSLLLIKTSEDLKEISTILGSLFLNERMKEVLTTAHRFELPLKEIKEHKLKLLEVLEEFMIGRKKINEETKEEVFLINYDFQKEFLGKRDPFHYVIRLAKLFTHLDKLIELNNQHLSLLIGRVIKLFPATIVTGENSILTQINSIVDDLSKGVDINKNLKILKEIKEKIVNQSELSITFIGRLIEYGNDSEKLEKVINSDILFLENINQFLHCMRHPKTSESYIKEWMNNLKTKTKLFVNYLPSCSDEGKYFTVVTFIDDDESLEFAQEYWKIYTSIIHRIIGYGVIKQIPIREHFIASNYRLYGHSFNNQQIMDYFAKGSHYMNQRTSTFWTNSSELRDAIRIQILQKRQIKAEKELSRQLTKENEKRVRRRIRRINEFVLNVMLNYLNFIVETNEIGKSSGNFNLTEIISAIDNIENFQRIVGDGSAKLIKRVVSSTNKKMWDRFLEDPTYYQDILDKGKRLIKAWIDDEKILDTDIKSTPSFKAISMLMKIDITWHSDIIQRWLVLDPIGCFNYDQQAVTVIQAFHDSKEDKLNITNVVTDALVDFITAKIVLALLKSSATMISEPLLSPYLMRSTWIDNFFDQDEFDCSYEQYLDKLSISLIPFLNKKDKTITDAIIELEQGPVGIQIIMNHISSKLGIILQNLGSFDSYKKRKAKFDSEILNKAIEDNLINNPFDLQEVIEKEILPNRDLSDLLRAMLIHSKNNPSSKVFLKETKGIVPNENLKIFLTPSNIEIELQSKFDKKISEI